MGQLRIHGAELKEKLYLKQAGLRYHKFDFIILFRVTFKSFFKLSIASFTLFLLIFADQSFSFLFKSLYRR